VARTVGTSDAARHPNLKPVRVPILAQTVFGEALDLARELPGWTVVSQDERALVIVCQRAGGLFGAPATVTITVTGPPGLPSAEVHCRSESRGGLCGRDRRNVIEFMEPFHRRVC